MRSAKMRIGAAALAGLMLVAPMALAQEPPGATATATATDHGHAHGHDHGKAEQAGDAQQIYKGYFKDEQVAARPLSDWAGDWQSVYPLLADGSLDPVMDHKAAHGDKSAAEYRAYYETGYVTDVNRIEIVGDKVTFHRPDGAVQGVYANDGYEILTYAKGNRGVRYVFKKTGGDADAPGFIQFSDHGIAPAKSGHYHLYWGDDRAALLQEVTHWPTYYPQALSREEVVAEMLAH